MSKYLKKFETQAAYEAAQSSLILPNVSLTVDNNTVHYNPYTAPIIDGHEYVDLGLPSGTKWATMNVGASSETDYGNYYQYGKGVNDVYITSGETDYAGTENPLYSSADTAVQVWGGQWHTPTSAQCQELIDNTEYEYTSINGVNGGKFTASNGNYVFFPAGGNWYDSSWRGVGSSGTYYTSTPRANAYTVFLFNAARTSSVYVNYGQKSNGLPVRPVVD